jgi:hypothetical protein
LPVLGPGTSRQLPWLEPSPEPLPVVVEDGADERVVGELPPGGIAPRVAADKAGLLQRQEDPSGRPAVSPALPELPAEPPEEVDAPYVLAFQLQVVCRRLWNVSAEMTAMRFAPDQGK